MGGIRLPPSVDEIRKAITSTDDKLAFHRLHHTLSQHTPPSPLLPSLLEGLCHLTSRLHTSHTTSSTTQNLRCLIDTALQTIHHTLALPQLAYEESYEKFITNLLSVDATYVDTLVSRIVPRCFLCSKFALGVSITKSVLSKYGRRGQVLVVQALKFGYPHLVRSEEDHVNYVKGLLTLCKSNNDNRISEFIINNVMNMTYEKISGIQVTNNHSKLSKILLIVIQYIKSQSTQPNFKTLHLQSLYNSYGSYILPLPSNSSMNISVYVLIYALSISGYNTTVNICDKLRQGFHDSSIDGTLRISYLLHSSYVITRCRNLTSKDVLTWLSRTCAWLNTYIDSISTNNSNDNNDMDMDMDTDVVDVDVEVHAVFYAACAIIMKTVVGRKDIINGKKRGIEIIARLRLGRILYSKLKPLGVIDTALVSEFLEVTKVTGGDNYNETEFGNGDDVVVIKSRTKSGGWNRMEGFGLDVDGHGRRDLLKNIDGMDEILNEIEQYVRWDDDDSNNSDIENKCSSIDGVKRKVIVGVGVSPAKKRVRFSDILSVSTSIIK